MFELDLSMKCLRWWMLWKSIQQLLKWLRRCCRENVFLAFFLPRFIVECTPPKFNSKSSENPSQKEASLPTIHFSGGELLNFGGCTGWKCVFFFLPQVSIQVTSNRYSVIRYVFLAAGALYIGRVNLWCGHPPREGL